jgi:transposase-like protein
LHRPIVRKFRKRMVYVKGIDDTWAADLIDMQSFAKFNDGVKYLLSVIDIFSKYGWIVPIKDKTGKSVADAFDKIFTSSGRKPDKLWVDKGKEFYNKLVKSLGVELYSTENEEKSCVIERWNRTMKEKMFKYFTANSTRQYIDVLDNMVSLYNNTRHTSIKMTPTKASIKANEKAVWLNLYGGLYPEPPDKPTFQVGDKVRISKKKSIFSKGYSPRWTEEIFTVSQIQYTDPITYKIADCNGEEIQGTFYEQELQKTKQEIFRIEKILRKRGNKSLVKWVGYPESFNSWVNNKALMSL